jgi:7-cyano-7-deazaguanine synthase
MPDKVVVVLSGGQDSTTCLYIAKERGHVIHTVTFDYGQRHARELDAANAIADYAWVESHEEIDIRDTLQSTSPILSDNELEQYEDYNSLPGGLEKTFVPMRNQLFLTIAANRAYVLGAEVIITGVSAEDYGGYPDCRPAFIRTLEKASSLGTFTGLDAPGPLNIVTPLMYLTKRQTVELAMTLPGCYEALALTHTGYDGAYPPTGKDHATLLRAKGFDEARIPDPLILRAYLEEKLEDLPRSPAYEVDIYNYLPRIQNVVNWLKDYNAA